MSASDHPRIRGEHFVLPRRHPPDKGSSPHTRGALRQQHLPRAGGGIIPAYAGSTCRKPSFRRKIGDHPRIRGEHYHTPLKVWIKQGSSPHTRGAPFARHDRRVERGIIPAYAGSTTSGATRAKSTPDHPRIRGEHKDQHTQAMIMFGSSPHTRGALDGRARRRRYVGIIPAYAGSTRQSRSPRAKPADHPRIRGEHLRRQSFV